MRIGLIGVGRSGVFHAGTLLGQGSKDYVGVGTGDRPSLRSVEQRVDFLAAMPYTEFMQGFLEGCDNERVAFTDLASGRTETPCSAQLARVVEACDLARCLDLMDEQGMPDSEASGADHAAAGLVHGGVS